MVGINALDARWLHEGAADENQYQEFLTRRQAGEPVHRILGWREFWGMKFYLSPETLEPRPDSETMIEVLLKETPDKNFQFRILDMGTGTGCLLLAALKEFPNATGIGIDQSADAIATAEKNAIENNLAARAKFLQLDWHDTDRLCALGTFDIILCNPPYIPTHNIEDLQSEVRQHDPMRALDGGPDGLAPYRIIAPHLAHLLKRTAIALFEFGHDQATDIQDIMSSHHYQTSPAYQDLGGNDRVIIVSNKNS